MSTKSVAKKRAFERLDALYDLAERELETFKHTMYLMKKAGYGESEIEDIRQHLYGIIESLEDTLPGLQMDIEDDTNTWNDFPPR